MLGVVLTGSLTASTTVALAASATLELQPTQGPLGTAITATYTYTPDAGSSCPRASVAFTWDGKDFAAQPLTQTASGCKATLSITPPAGSTAPGGHEVCGIYTQPASPLGPAIPVKACGTFTVTAAATPSPSPAPTVAPTAAPTAAPVATTVPTAAPTTAAVSTPSPAASLTASASPASSSIALTSATPSVSPVVVGGTRGTESPTPPPPTPSDGGGGIAALTDGLLIIRYLPVVAVGVGVLLLGGLIIRYLFGLRGPALSKEMGPDPGGPTDGGGAQGEPQVRDTIWGDTDIDKYDAPMPPAPGIILNTSGGGFIEQSAPVPGAPAGGGAPGPAASAATKYDALTDGLMILRSATPGPGDPAGGKFFPSGVGVPVANDAPIQPTDSAGGNPQGSFKIADNESPRPTDRSMPISVSDVNGDGVPEIDGNGQTDALTDGLLLRTAPGPGGAAGGGGAQGEPSARTSPAQIEAYIPSILPIRAPRPGDPAGGGITAPKPIDSAGGDGVPGEPSVTVPVADSVVEASETVVVPGPGSSDGGTNAPGEATTPTHTGTILNDDGLLANKDGTILNDDGLRGTHLA